MKKRLVEWMGIVFLSCFFIFSPYGSLCVDAQTNDKGHLFVGEVAIDSQNFPDPIFQEYVKNTIAKGSESLTQEMIKTVKELNLSKLKIKSIKGIEFFSFLESLNCNGLGLTTVDLSKNTYLLDLKISNNQLTELDLRANVTLNSLEARGNKLTAIDVRQNPRLKNLYIEDNQINEIDVSNNKQLIGLYFSRNRLKTIDLSQNSLLQTLYVDSNPLEELNLKSNPTIGTILANNTPLITLDVSNNPKLFQLYLTKTKIKSIDVRQNPKLKTFVAGNISLTKLDVTQNPELQHLSVGSNKLTTIDLSQNLKLQILEIGNNDLSELDIKYNTELLTLTADNNKLMKLDTTNNPKLSELTVGRNGLTELDTQNNKQLSSLHVDSNKLKKLNIQHLPLLKTLNCGMNFLTELDVTNQAELLYLRANSNQLNVLDVTNNPKLSSLYVQFNHLTSIDVTNNSLLDFKSSDFHNQAATADIYYEKGRWFIDFTQFSKLVAGNVNIEESGWQYDKITGKASISGTYSEPPKQLTYNYLLRDQNQMDVTLTLNALIAQGEPVTIHYKDIKGNKIKNSTELTGNLGDSWQVTPPEIDDYFFQEAQGNTAGKFTELIQEVTFIYKQGALEITSLPADIDFGVHTVGNKTRVEMPLLSAPLIVADQRSRRTNWALNVKLTQKLTHEEDSSIVLPQAIRYKKSDDIEEILGEQQIIIYKNDTKEMGEFEISRHWSDGKEGLKLETGAYEVLKKGGYKAIIFWELGVYP